LSARGAEAFFFHLATPLGEGGLALFELFGTGVEAALERLFRCRALPGEGRARLGGFADLGGEVVDEAILARLGAAASWFRLPAWALSVHGGIWIQDRVVAVLESAGGVRLSLRGVLRESLRSGAMDALEAAAAELLVEARTERAAAFLLRQQAGELSCRLEECLAMLERDATGAGEGVARRLEALLFSSRAASRLCRPLRLLLAGRPNSGKSTLFNRLVERRRAVVSRRPGTTRDFNRETIDVGGFPVVVSDSAGVRRAAADPIEEEAIRRVWRESADAVVYLLAPPWRLEPEEDRFLQRLPAACRIVANNFSDLGDPPRSAGVALSISALTGAGVDTLRREILRRWLGPEPGGAADAAAPFNRCQVQIIEAGLDAWRATGGPAGIDALREAIIILLRSSWPNGERGDDPERTRAP
jgi:tRNA modification GTPase